MALAVQLITSITLLTLITTINDMTLTERCLRCAPREDGYRSHCPLPQSRGNVPSPSRTPSSNTQFSMRVDIFCGQLSVCK